MKISNKKVVSIDYTLTNPQGEILDSSSGRGPLVYIQGARNIIPGLEKELEGKEVGDQLIAIIPPEEAYGVYNKDLVQTVPLENFQDVSDVRVGAQFQLQAVDYVHIATVTEVKEDHAVLDMNHALADQTLHFDVEVIAIRDATQEELEHGHVHGEGEHHHD